MSETMDVYISGTGTRRPVLKDVTFKEVGEEVRWFRTCTLDQLPYLVQDLYRKHGINREVLVRTDKVDGKIVLLLIVSELRGSL